MMISAIYKYNTENGTVWSANGCGIKEDGKWYKKCAMMEVKCERMEADEFFNAIQSEEFRTEHKYDWKKDPQYASVIELAGIGKD